MDALRFALLGLASGSLVVLIALGIVIAYRASGVLNIAAGAIGAAGAYVFYFLRDEQGLEWKLALPLGLVTGALLGALTQLVVLRSLRRASVLVKLIGTLGVMAVILGAINVIWGSQSRGQPDSILPTERITLFGEIVIGSDRLMLIGLGLIIAVILKLLYSRTTFGLATSAVAENRQAAAIGGWSPSHVELVNFTLAGALTALAVILMAPIVGLQGVALALVFVPALAAALVGQFSSFFLTTVAALGIAVMQSELGFYQPDIAEALHMDPASLSGLPLAVPMIVIIAATVVRGRARLARGDVESKLPLPGSGQLRPVWIVAGVLAGTGLMMVGSATWTDALVTTFIMGILVLSVIVVTGYAGQLSLAQLALAGFGAWVAARCSDLFGLPFEVCLLVAVIATVPVGLIVALPALRSRGVDLAVATLGLALMLQAVVFNNGALTGGFTGTKVEPPAFFGIDLQPILEPRRYGFFVAACFLLCALLVSNLRRGRAGRRLLAVRSNERAAASLGVGVYGAKLYAFALSSAVAALAGVLLAFRRENVLFRQFDVFGSITVVQNAVLGGVAWVSGALFGGAIASGGLLEHELREVSPSAGAWTLVIGGVVVLAVLRWSPDGLASRLRVRWPRAASRAPVIVESRSARSPASLEVRNVTVRFGGVTALEDASLQVHPGEVLGLIGPNGAGKTTLVDVVSGFTRATEGAVHFEDVTIDRWSPERRVRAGIARSWQAVELFEELTVRENLYVAADFKNAHRYVLDLVHPGRQAVPRSMVDVINEFGLGDALDERPSSLPHGLSRLVGIARVICTEPRVLLLDEPSAGLDEQESRELGIAVRRIAERRGIGVLLIEHDVPLVMSICDRIVVLDFGKVLAEGTPAEIRQDQRVLDAYLGASEAVIEPTGLPA